MSVEAAQLSKSYLLNYHRSESQNKGGGAGTGKCVVVVVVVGEAELIGFAQYLKPL